MAPLFQKTSCQQFRNHVGCELHVFQGFILSWRSLGGSCLDLNSKSFAGRDSALTIYPQHLLCLMHDGECLLIQLEVEEQTMHLQARRDGGNCFGKV